MLTHLSEMSLDSKLQTPNSLCRLSEYTSTKNRNGNGNLVSQDCNNGGLCVAPDVCKCARWDNAFRDGREEGGRPMFLKPNGDPQKTGWTGYDCSVPICVQVSTENISVTRNLQLRTAMLLFARPPCLPDVNG